MIHTIVQVIAQNLEHKPMIIRTLISYKCLSLKSKFLSKNVINLSRRNIFSPEISLLSKNLKFVLAAKTRKI